MARVDRLSYLAAMILNVCQRCRPPPSRSRSMAALCAAPRRVVTSQRKAAAAKAAAAVVAPAVAASPELAGAAMVTAAYVVLAMNFMPLGPIAGLVGASPAQIKWGDRAFGNLVEHAPLFLSSLWCFAVFVSAAEAAKIGAVYVALRALYPVVWAVFGGAKGVPFSPYTWFLFGTSFNIFYLTFPMYGCVMYMAAATLLKLGMSVDLNALVMTPAVVAPVGFGLFLYHFALGCFPFIQKAVMPLFAEK